MVAQLDWRRVKNTILFLNITKIQVGQPYNYIGLIQTKSDKLFHNKDCTTYMHYLMVDLEVIITLVLDTEPSESAILILKLITIGG